MVVQSRDSPLLSHNAGTDALSASTATILITNNKFSKSSCCPLIEPKKFFEVLAKAGMSEGFQTFAFSFVS